MEEVYYETYMFIINFIKENGYPPTYRELSDGLGYTLSTIARRIYKLVDLGKIEIKDKSPRLIKVVGHEFDKKSKQQNEYLFVTKFNTPLNSVIYSDAIKAVIRQINLTRPFDNQFEVFSGHTFRHTFVTRCFENGVDAKVVQSYLGHASLKMTMDLYTYVTEEKSVADIEKIVPQSKN